MSILFLSSENKINEQEKLLMLSLLESSSPFIYACPENSLLAGMANSCGLPFMEVTSSFWLQVFRLKKYIKTNSIKNIHALDEKALKVARYIKMSMGDSLRIIVSHHAPIDYNIPKPFQGKNAYAIRNFLTQKAQILFVSSLELFNTVQNQKIKNSSLELLHYAVNLKETFPKESSQNLVKHNSSKRFIFLVETPFEKSSGIELLFEAIIRLKTQLSPDDPIVEVHLLGSGSLFDEFMDKAHELEIAQMLAFFRNHDYHLFYKNSHAAICPSTTGEGDYRAILNGWRASIPVISSDISAHTRLVLSGKSEQSALIFPRDSSEKLAKCMLQLVHDKSVRENLVLTAKEMLKASQHSTLKDKYLKTLDNYK